MSRHLDLIRSGRPLATLGLLLLLAATPTWACPPLGVLPDEPNGIELAFGATNVNAAVGSGHLTAGLSRCGEITVLKWPGPSYYDQLTYLTSNAADARALPHMGALPDMGAFAGIFYEGRGVKGFSWLRDTEWTQTQRYTSETSAVVRNDATRSDLGLHVTQWSFVLPDADVLVMHYAVERDADSPVRRARLVFYTNLGPSLQRMAEIPLGDWALDHQNDFAVLYDAREHAFLHFRPETASYAPLNPVLQDPPSNGAALENAVEKLVDESTQPGAYLTVGSRQDDDGHQAGFDDSPLCDYQSELVNRALTGFGVPPDFVSAARLLFVCNTTVTNPDGVLGKCRDGNGWTYEATSAYEDAADGKLSGSPIAACQANAALSRDLEFADDRAEATFYVTAAGSRDGAFDLLREARDITTTPQAQRAATEAWWAQHLESSRLPDTDDDVVRRFARRSIATLTTATDAASGAIVASISTQPPYGLDWPRDGAFINHALDLAGYGDAVARHDRFYARVQRTTFEPWSFFFPYQCPADPSLQSYPDCVPPGSFQMNYYADPAAAVAGGPISFEIDETGLAVWAMWDHAGYITDSGERAAYLADVCPAIELGATNLASCRDATTGLQCPAAEDDNLELTQKLQGAETVDLALRSAVAAATDCGFDASEVASWSAREAELTQAIVDQFYVAGTQPHFDGPRGAWVVWPLELLPANDPRMMEQSDYLIENAVDPVIARTAPGAGYNSENLLARAHLLRSLGDLTDLGPVRDKARFLMKEIATPDTGQLGEFAGRVDVDLDGDGISPDYMPENAVPHAWQHAYLYAAGIEAFGSRTQPPLQPCDVSGDGHIDAYDTELLGEACGAPATGPLAPHDLTGDGTIDRADLRACIAACETEDCVSSVDASAQEASLEVAGSQRLSVAGVGRTVTPLALDVAVGGGTWTATDADGNVLSGTATKRGGGHRFALEMDPRSSALFACLLAPTAEQLLGVASETTVRRTPRIRLRLRRTGEGGTIDGRLRLSLRTIDATHPGRYRFRAVDHRGSTGG